MKLPIQRVCFLLGSTVPVILVAFAVVLTVAYYVAACPLCVVQRLLYLAIAAAAVIGLLSREITALRRIAALLMSLGSSTGAVITGYQIYLQRNPFIATCGDGSAWWEKMVEKLGNTIPILLKADGLCSDDSFSLLGLSIPEWSLLAFGGLLLISIIALFSRQKK